MLAFCGYTSSHSKFASRIAKITLHHRHNPDIQIIDPAFKCHVNSSLALSDPESVKLTQDCQFLESMLCCLGVADLVHNENNSLSAIKMGIIEANWNLCLTEATSHQSTSLAAKIAICTTWPKIWDMALLHVR